MDEVFGFISFFMGLAILVSDTFKTNNNVPWWLVMIGAGLMTYGLGAVIRAETSDLRNEIQELRDEIDELKGH